jgi:hypothetical protein
MWHEYVRSPSRANARIQMFKDFVVVGIFGVLAISVTNAQTVKSLLNRILWFLGIAVVWAGLELFLKRFSSTKPRGDWRFWLWLNGAQFVVTAVLRTGWRCFGEFQVPWTKWSLALVLLALAYLVFLLVDLHFQLKILANEPPPASIAVRE